MVSQVSDRAYQTLILKHANMFWVLLYAIADIFHSHDDHPGLGIVLLVLKYTTI